MTEHDYDRENAEYEVREEARWRADDWLCMGCGEWQDARRIAYKTDSGCVCEDCRDQAELMREGE